MNLRGTLLGALGALAVLSCAVYDPPDVIHVAAPSSPESIHFETVADAGTRGEVEGRLRAELGRIRPDLKPVDHPALADILVHYEFDDDIRCVHCEHDIARQWFWLAHLKFKTGGEMVLTGEVDKFRGHPERFFVRQLAQHVPVRNGRQR